MAVSLFYNSGLKSPATASDTSYTLTVPAHAANDIIIVTLNYNRSSGGDPVHVGPTGFTQRGFARRDANIAFQAIFDRIDTDNTITSVTVSTGAATSAPLLASVVILRGVDLVSPIGPKYSSAMYNAQSSALSAPLPDASPSGSYTVAAFAANSGFTISSGLSAGFNDLTGNTASLNGKTIGSASSTTAVLNPGFTASKSLFWSSVAVTYLPALAASSTAAAVSSVGWNAFGGVDSQSGLSDALDTTGIETTDLSSAQPVSVTLGPMRPPNSQESLQVTVRGQRTTGSSGTWKAELVIDGTLASTVTVASRGTTIEDLVFNFPSADIDSRPAAAWSSGVVVRIMPTVIA